MEEEQQLQCGLWDSKISEEAREKAYQERCPSSMEEEKRTISVSDARPRGKEFGTVMHRCFELGAFALANGFTADKEQIVNQAIMESYDELMQTGSDVENVRDYLQSCMNSYLSSPLAQDILNAKHVYEEMPFHYCDNGEWIHGFADLVLINPDDSIVVVDYKSDCKDDNETIEEFEAYLMKTYGKQLQLYVDSMKRLFGKDDVTFRFYHLYQKG